MMRILYLVNLVFLIFFFTLEPVAQGVMLQWDHNAEPDLDGYIVCFGTSSGYYPEKVDVGYVRSYKLRNLKEVEN